MSRINVSDLTASNINQGGALALPRRSEKIVLSSPVDPSTPSADYHISAALRKYSAFMTVRMAGRGGAPGVFDPNSSAEYRFLIAPSECQVQHQTIDEQIYTRSGWQIGVWGGDFISITINGKTPGKYFDGGLTDFYTPYSQSWRNLAALEMVVENNGYWFEGEQVSSSLQQSTRRIKMHQDVELACGDFIWNGMFESMEITEDADSPYLADFTLTFIAWQERFRSDSPYWLYGNLIGGEVQRGHVPINSTASAASQPVATTAMTGPGGDPSPQTTAALTMLDPVGFGSDFWNTQ